MNIVNTATPTKASASAELHHGATLEVSSANAGADDQAIVERILMAAVMGLGRPRSKVALVADVRERNVRFCDGCFMQLSANGVCEDCE